MPQALTSPDGVTLSNDEIRRYSRHLILPDIGVDGQKRLKAAKVLLIGTGGLGAPVAMYLAAAGVGTLGLVDFDTVDISNLQRQIIHGESTIGQSKLASAAARIADINPHVAVRPHAFALDSSNALDVMRDYNLVIDGTDNFPTRYLVNDACVLLGKPNVYGSIYRFEGQASVFWAAHGPCYRCLYPEPPPPGLVPSCAEGGVLGVLPGMIGVIQATEAVKLITGQGETLISRLLTYDALEMRYREMKLRRDPNCPICGKQPSIHALIDYEAFCGVASRTAPATNDIAEISVQDLQTRIAAGLSKTRTLLLDVREPHEWQIAHLDAAKLMPKDTVAEHLDEFAAYDEILVHCKSGGRSADVVRFLTRDAGLKNVKNVAGGIIAWAREIDPAIPVY
jgi:sulfur-carrier protein adenylyltransferase/sulfurtransferase